MTRGLAETRYLERAELPLVRRLTIAGDGCGVDKKIATPRIEDVRREQHLSPVVGRTDASHARDGFEQDLTTFHDLVPFEASTFEKRFCCIATITYDDWGARRTFRWRGEMAAMAADEEAADEETPIGGR